MVEAAELVRVNRAELLRRMAGVFVRREPWQQAGKYLDGLASARTVLAGIWLLKD